LQQEKDVTRTSVKGGFHQKWTNTSGWSCCEYLPKTGVDTINVRSKIFKVAGLDAAFIDRRGGADIVNIGTPPIGVGGTSPQKCQVT